MRTKPIGGQESLFTIIPSGEVYIPDQDHCYEDGAAVPILDRTVHLLAALDILGETSQYGGFVKALEVGARANIVNRYGDNAIAKVSQGVQNNRLIAAKQAKWEFARASGMFALIDSGLMDNREASERTKGLYGHFEARFAGPHGTLERSRLRKILTGNLRVVELDATQENREQGLRPNKEQDIATVEQNQDFGTRERLIAIAEDPRAGFYPTTHREKNTVLTYLDYLDNPAYPLGVNNQRFEIFNHQERLRSLGSLGGGRATESITYEIVDYLVDTKKQLAALLDLEVALADMINPRVTLADEIPDYHKGMLPLLRFKEIDSYSKLNSKTTFHDPLTTKEKRWARGDALGRHKSVYDQYTIPNEHDQQVALMSKVASLTVSEARPLLQHAITDQAKRAKFMTDRVTEISQLPYSALARSRDIAAATLNTLGIRL